VQPKKISRKLLSKHLKNRSKHMTLRYIFLFLILFFLVNSGISAQTRELTDGTEFFFGIPQCGATVTCLNLCKFVGISGNRTIIKPFLISAIKLP
jgi:hypothetical protein